MKHHHHHYADKKANNMKKDSDKNATKDSGRKTEKPSYWQRRRSITIKMTMLPKQKIPTKPIKMTATGVTLDRCVAMCASLHLKCSFIRLEAYNGWSKSLHPSVYDCD